jgi:hypothetical protein
MLTKSLGQLEEHAAFIMFMATIAILYTHAVWGLADKFEEHIGTNHNIQKIHFHIFTLIVVTLIIGICPRILVRL